MSSQSKLKQAFDQLRSSSSELDQSFCAELGDRLVRQQRRQLNRRPWKGPVLWISIAFGSILIVGAVGSAANGTWRNWLYTFWVGSDGTVTDRNARIVGKAFENEDGSHSTIIKPHGRSYSYEIHSDAPLNGSEVHMEPVGR